MHENPDATESAATEKEQELAQTDRMDEEEEQRSGYAPADASEEGEEG